MCGLCCLFLFLAARVCLFLSFVLCLPLHVGGGLSAASLCGAVLALHALAVLHRCLHWWQTRRTVGGLCGVEDDNVRFALAVLLMQVGERLAYLHPHHAVEPLLVVVIFLRRRCLLRCRGLRAFAAGETQGNCQRERRKVFSPLLF